MARYIDADELKRRILFERDKIPFTLPGATYEFGIAKPNQHGNSMRGGIRKALRCMEQCKTVDAVPVVRCRECKKWHPDIGWCDEHSHFVDSDENFCHPHESSNWKMFDADYFCKDGERKCNGC